MKNKIINKLRITFKIIVIINLIVATYYFLGRNMGRGDESLFIIDLELIKSAGWIAAIKKSISIPYMLLAYPLSFIFDSYIALRIVSVALISGMLGYFYIVRKENSKDLFYYLIFYISCESVFFSGTNDTLFFVSLIIFLNEVYLIRQNKVKDLNILLSFLIISIFTRQLFVVYLPVILIGIYIVYKSKIRLNRKSLIPFGLFLFFIFMNIPSLIEKGRLSYDDKSAPKETNVSWSQRQYLAQLMVNNGELENFQHPSWEVTRAYLDKNGEDSLPDGIINGMTFDYALTIKEFFKDFAYSVGTSTRSFGLMLFITFFYFGNQMLKDRNNLLDNFIPLSTLVMLSIFSLIIMSYVETRWLDPVFIMT
ncbi:MAG: hypothetical protein ABWY22_14885, partial [Flavobacterium sp.]